MSVVSSKKHDVFISFRGEDTRKTFTSHLHHALCKENIETYIDYNINKGNEVWPALVQAIRESHISIVVFSENYADSKWCLDELVEILKCREHHEQVVIPIFYGINPTHVRYQTGSYERAFAKYQKQHSSSSSSNESSYEVKVSDWKAALSEAANISGWTSGGHRDDSQVLEDIVKDVLQKLSLMYPNDLKHLIEIDRNSGYIESLGMNFLRIGIWGMPGIGKTTIAKQMFGKHFAKHDNACFLENVREEIEKFGVPYVRAKLVRELIKQQITPSDVAVGATFIKRRLSGKNVFIVLDDVDKFTQLEDLFQELNELGPKSVLIITTRDRSVLGGGIVDKIYEVPEWEFDESLQLFSLGAFKQRYPKEGYERLSERAVKYAGGVPLALKVLGSHFYSIGPNPIRWQNELNYLEENSVGECFDEIQQPLKVSYNGLKVREKEMFLDIAFFFMDENIGFVTRILDASSSVSNATRGIQMLEDKAFITISKSNRIQMHDLLLKMALDMVRMDRVENRTRLRDFEEVRDVLRNTTKGVHNKVEGIIFDLSQKVNLHFQADAFHMMPHLKYLKLYVPLGNSRLVTMFLPQVMRMPFSNKLRYFEWNGYPFRSLPPLFCAELLVEIRLPHSNIQHLWEGMQELGNLQAIDLIDCKELMKLPDLSRASKLKWMYLSGCESLREVEPCVFSKDTLVTLLLDGCKNLQSLISEKHLRSLEKINVYGCSSLKEFSLSSDSIESLDLSNTGIEILHSSIGSQSKLMWLNIEGLRLMNLPNELSHLRSLTELWISKCDIVTKSKLETLFDGLVSLKILSLKDCGKLLELPTNISSLQSLYDLRLDGSSVKSFPDSIKYIPDLEILSLNNCTKLRYLLELPPQIKEFHADNCASLVSVFTLKTLSKSMKGKEKYISFKNDMTLDKPSLDRIMEDAILTMESAAFHNVLVRKYNLQTRGYNYNSAEFCLPGSRVPRQYFKYQTTSSSSSLTITFPQLSYLLGFIFSVVVSPSSTVNVMKEHHIGAKIQCQCYSRDAKKLGYASMWHRKPVTNFNSDHVFVWYDPYHSDSILILANDETKVSFQFYVTNDKGEDQHDGLFTVKECGICPIYFSKMPRL